MNCTQASSLGNIGKLRDQHSVILSHGQVPAVNLSSRLLGGCGQPGIRFETREGHRSNFSLRPACYRLHATKAEMIGPGGDFAFAVCAHHVTRAILVGAQKRAAAVNFLFVVRFRLDRRACPALADFSSLVRGWQLITPLAVLLVY